MEQDTSTTNCSPSPSLLLNATETEAPSSKSATNGCHHHHDDDDELTEEGEGGGGFLSVSKDLRNRYRGTISLPGHVNFYECIGPTFNKAFSKRKPCIIFCPRGVSDVQKSVRFAREHNLPIAIKCGGHNGAGSSSIHGGALINLGYYMRGCILDAKNRTVLVEGGCILGDIDRELEEYNLAVPLGTYPGTGIGGLCLHGGIGHLMKRVNHATCDCILEMNVVLADGSVVTCSRKENDDLFWAMKGWGGNFGIVTSCVFKCFPVPTSVYGGFCFQPIVDLHSILNANAKLLTNEKDYSSLISISNPPGGPEKGMTGLHIVHFGSEQDKIDEQLKDILVTDPVPPGLGNLKRQTYHKANMATDGLPDPQSCQYWRLFMTREWTPSHSNICEKAFKYIKETPLISNESFIVIEKWERDAKTHSLHSSWNFDGFAFCMEVIIGWIGVENNEKGMVCVEAIKELILEGRYWKTQSQMGMGYVNYTMTYSEKETNNNSGGSGGGGGLCIG